MAAKGVALAEGGAQGGRHFDPRGGQLISEAGRMHAEDLATGMLLYEESREEAHCQSLYDGQGREAGRKERALT
jgi:hypothetical protein